MEDLDDFFNVEIIPFPFLREEIASKISEIRLGSSNEGSINLNKYILEFSPEKEEVAIINNLSPDIPIVVMSFDDFLKALQRNQIEDSKRNWLTNLLRKLFP